MSNQRTETIQVRINRVELERFKRAARARNPHDAPNLSAYLRSVAHEDADRLGIEKTPELTKESK